jgi:hypothetical protein
MRIGTVSSQLAEVDRPWFDSVLLTDLAIAAMHEQPTTARNRPANRPDISLSPQAGTGHSPARWCPSGGSCRRGRG